MLTDKVLRDIGTNSYRILLASFRETRWRSYAVKKLTS